MTTMEELEEQIFNTIMSLRNSKGPYIKYVGGRAGGFFRGHEIF